MIIYTAIFGTVGDVLQPVPQEADVECHAFTESVTVSTQHETGWLLRPPMWPAQNRAERSMRMLARRHKLLSHHVFPNAEVTLWLDGNFTPRGRMRELLQYLSQHDMCIFSHRERSCTYREIEACIRLRKDDRGILRALLTRYQREGFPPGLGLPETGVLLRRHTPAICRFNEVWWQELSQHSVRDQVSIQYVCWKLQQTYASFPGTFDIWPYCHYKPHKYKPQR